MARKVRKAPPVPFNKRRANYLHHVSKQPREVSGELPDGTKFTARGDAVLFSIPLPCSLCGRGIKEHHRSSDNGEWHCPILPAMKFDKPWRQSTCRTCGLKMLFNDTEFKVAHEAPQCPEFLAACAMAGASEKVDFFVVDT